MGRHEELTRLNAFLARARADGDALLILGEPGARKSLLLDVAAEAAAATRVLRARGVELEAAGSFAARNPLAASADVLR